MTVTSAMQGQPSLTEGARFGPYRVTRAMAVGGMGEVYEAVHTGLGKRVALKTLRADLAGVEEVRERFLREGRNASRVDHPNIVAVNDVGEHEGTPYLVMEYLQGESLAAFYERRAPLSEQEVCDILLPVICALAAAHAKHVIHRDIKPHNIFLAQTGDGRTVTKLLDFGISKVLKTRDSALTQTSAVMGTPHYMSPEQASGSSALDWRVDQYAIGVVIYEGVTGRRPFELQTGEAVLKLVNDIVHGEFEPPRSSNPLVSADFEDLVLGCMRTHPDERHDSMSSLAEALMDYASEDLQVLLRPSVANLPMPGTSDSLTPEKVELALLHTEVSGIQVSEPPPTGEVVSSRRVLYTLFGGLLGLGVALALAVTWGAEADRESVTGPGPSRDQTGTPAPGAPPTPAPNRPEVAVADAGQRGAPLQRYNWKLVTTPEDARIDLDGRFLGTGSAAGQLMVDGRSHVLRVYRSGFLEERIHFADVAPPASIALRRLQAAPTGQGSEASAPGPKTDAATRRAKRGTSRASRPPKKAGRAKASPGPVAAPTRQQPTPAPDPASRRKGGLRTDNRDPWAEP